MLHDVMRYPFHLADDHNLLMLSSALSLLVPVTVCALRGWFLRYILSYRCQVLELSNHMRMHCKVEKTKQNNEHVLVPVAIQLQRSPTALLRSLEVSQRASMAARGGDPTTPSRTAPRSQRVTQSQGASPPGPNHSKPRQKSKTSQLERRSAWRMWRR